MKIFFKTQAAIILISFTLLTFPLPSIAKEKVPTQTKNIQIISNPYQTYDSYGEPLQVGNNIINVSIEDIKQRLLDHKPVQYMENQGAENRTINAEWITNALKKTLGGGVFIRHAIIVGNLDFHIINKLVPISRCVKDEDEKIILTSQDVQGVYYIANDIVIHDCQLQGSLDASYKKQREYMISDNTKNIVMFEFISLCNNSMAKEVDFSFASFKGRSVFYGTNFNGRVNFRNTYFNNEACFRGTSFNGQADFQNTLFNGQANFQNANLENAKLSNAIMTNSEFIETNLNDAVISGVDLTGAQYEPNSSPHQGSLGGIKGLKTVWFEKGKQSGLVQLRTSLKEAGLRDLEREATFAIEHGKTSYAPRYEKWPKLILFEWTCNYGLDYLRPLKILLCMIGIYTLVYAFPINGVGASGIDRIWSQESSDKEEEKKNPDRIIASEFKGLGYALYFSILSAFHIGWRDLNVGSWISRIQPGDYTLRARGWVKTVSGIQSLISIYLLALWVLTQFGRPFE